jgi:hypothetical protein
MKKKIISILSICAFGIIGLGLGNIQPTNASATETTVYVSSSGSDENAGTSASPYETLDKALTEVPNGGTITLKDTIAVDSWTAHGKTVTITGGGLNVSGLPNSEFNDGKGTQMKEIVINDSVTFTNMTWTVDSTLETFIYANGNKMVFGEGVSYSQEKIRLFGGGKEGSMVASTNLTVLAGTYNYIYGGSLRGTVTGNTNLTVGGTVNNNDSDVDYEINSGHAFIYSVLGGGHVDTVKGSTNLVFQDAAKAVYVAGGAYGWGGTIAKGTNVTVTGGTIMGVYGSCLNGGHATSGASVRVEGGTMQQVFGGSEGQIVTGNVDVRLLGGKITRRVYAGSYGNGTTKYVVNGKINLELGGNVNITFGASQSDKGIYGRSRYNSDVEDCQIVFTSQAAYDSYKNKLGGSTLIMGSTSAADIYHYYTYTANDNVLTQSCAYHTELAATATLNLTGDCKYTGGKVTPVELSFSGDWEYNKPAMTYANNVEIGAATASVTAGDVTAQQKFVIVDTPTILGGSVRTANDSGLRFQSTVPSGLKDSGATFGTLIIPRQTLEKSGDLNLTHEHPYFAQKLIEDVPQTKWATEEVKNTKPHVYKEGNEYFNAVLTGIPEQHYDKVIVARSYVYANGKYYYAEEKERSIADVAAKALQAGDATETTIGVLQNYVDKALENYTLAIEGTAVVYEKESAQLTLTGNNGYVAIWSSDNNNILSVDENGQITAGKKEGKVTVTATIGTKTAKFDVIVKYRWTGYF